MVLKTLSKNKKQLEKEWSSNEIKEDGLSKYILNNDEQL